MSEAAVSIPQSDRSPEPDTNEQTRAGYPHARPPERLRATTRMVTVINASARARRVPVSVRYVPGVDPDPPVAPTRLPKRRGVPKGTTARRGYEWRKRT